MSQIKVLLNIYANLWPLGNKFKNVATGWGKNNGDSGKAA